MNETLLLMSLSILIISEINKGFQFRFLNLQMKYVGQNQQYSMRFFNMVERFIYFFLPYLSTILSRRLAVLQCIKLYYIKIQVEIPVSIEKKKMNQIKASNLFSALKKVFDWSVNRKAYGNFFNKESGEYTINM